MASLDYKILSISQPTIALEDMTKGYFETKHGSNYYLNSAPSEVTGAIAPFVKLNDLYLNGGSILTFSITQNSFLPELSMTFIDRDKLFTGIRAPKFKPIVSVYIKTTNPQLKSFRCDFLLTSAKPIHGAETIYSIRGELYVPNLYNNVSKAYANCLSFDALRTIAGELNLGFASNEEKPNDSMTWLAPNITYKGLIQHITKHAYKDESSYFTCFIDRYYMLNYVNIEKIMEANDLDQTFTGLNQMAAGQILKGWTDASADSDQTPRTAVVTNHPNIKSDDAFIINYAYDTNHGQILKEDFLKKRVMWYDHGDQQKVLSFFEQPITRPTPPADQEYQLTTDLTDFTTGEVVKWMGIDYHNTHKNYKFARLINSHNLKEIDKNVIRVVTRGINASLTRGMKVFACIFLDKGHQMASDMNSQTVPDGALSNVTYVDLYTSGQYYIRDITYKYTPNKNNGQDRFETEFWLARKEWLPAETLTTNPAQTQTNL